MKRREKSPSHQQNHRYKAPEVQVSWGSSKELKKDLAGRSRQGRGKTKRPRGPFQPDCTSHVQECSLHVKNNTEVSKDSKFINDTIRFASFKRVFWQLFKLACEKAREDVGTQSQVEGYGSSKSGSG